MPSERVQRQIDRLLDEAERALAENDWETVTARCEAVLRLDPENEDARTYRDAAAQGHGGADGAHPAPAVAPPVQALPASFAGGRYRVIRLLGEGGRKRVFLGRDELLQRDVALALVRTDGLDAPGRERILREARHMARLGGERNLVAVHDIADEAGSPLVVQEYMPGGDVAELLDRGPLAVERTLQIATDVCRGLAAMHAAGMVHRDLKPANVFLAADGTAKVGDFGLAVAGELTRLTMQGTLLGTVAYMPPEQAVGGDVDARSDLYSLGVMLYEMLVGRPPFAGDDATAVISQHLNTPPVAPSWHTEHCPPALEALVLRLLEKDPGKRPESATAVLEALARVNPEEMSERHSGENPLARLAQGVFVGRESELGRLRSAFDQAFAGRGSLVMLVGEPGVGKTRTAQEIETYAKLRGALVLWGRSHEASGAPAYWPWVQVGRQWGAITEPEAIVQLLGPAGGELVRLFPELKLLPGVAEPTPLADASAAQFRLFDGYVSFVNAVSRQRPLVITLDDLHWADRATLQLLQHLSRELGRMRVLVLCTYRDTDLVRTHPLSEALAEMGRDPGFERVVLRGLSRDEVRQYIASAAGIEPSRALVARVFEETEGNPFFVSEVVNLLTQEGSLVGDSTSDIRIPDGVKEALGRRLDRLSEDANGLLQVAAVIGREFTFDTLRYVFDRGEDVLLALVEEGLAARVIEEMDQPGRYRFTHALMQETLLGELSTTRRVRLQGQVGEALERRWGARANDYAPRLAQHFVEAAMLSPRLTERALHYSLVAAEASERRSAWDAAMGHYRDAVQIIEGSEEPDRLRLAGLLVDLGRSARSAGAERDAWRHLMRAVQLAREFGDGEIQARATLEAAALWAPAERMNALLDDAIRHAAGSDPHLVANLYARRADMWRARNAEEEAEAHAAAAEAHRLAREHGLDEVDAIVGLFHDALALGVDGQDGALPHLEAADRVFGERGMIAEQVRARRAISNYLGWTGRNGDAERAAREGLALASSAGGYPTEEALLLWQLAFMEGVRGRLQGVLDYTARDRTGHYLVAGARANFLAIFGDVAAARRALPAESTIPPAPELAAQALADRVFVLAADGRPDEAEAALDAVLELVPSTPRAHLQGTVASASNGLFLAGRDHHCRSLFEVAGTVGWLAGSQAVPTPGVAWAALRAGRLDDAEAIASRVIEVMRPQGAIVLVGMAQLVRAGVARARGDAAGALAQVDEAARQFRDCGAVTLLNLAIRMKTEIQGIAGVDSTESIAAVSHALDRERPDLSVDAAADGTVALLFSDIEGSTELNDRLGDVRWMSVLSEHNELVDAAIAAHRGRTVKTMGDGYMVVFADPARAIRCALAVQAAMADRDRGLPSGTGTRIRVRIGLHVGQAVRAGDDFFGREVNYAARVASAAAGGEVLASASVAGAARGGGWSYGEPRRLLLKGFTGEQDLFPVVRDGARADE